MATKEISANKMYCEQFGMSTMTVMSNVVMEPQSHWVNIQDRLATNLILNTLGDQQKQDILATAVTPMLISEILYKCKIPNTSGYRKINHLIKCGLLVKIDSITTQDGKNVARYKSLFERLQIDILRNRVTVSGQLAN